MKAFVYEKYGPPEVLKLRELLVPTPGDSQVLVKILAASINAADWRMMRADPFLVRLYAGLFRPKRVSVLGADIAGCVEAIGKNVTQFKVGDEVFGDLFATNFGGFAEYKCAEEKELVLKPSNCSFLEAAAIPLAALTALHAIRDVGKVKSEDKVLIYGASGGVGTFAIQLAKYYGATVTAVCSTKKVEQARALGADQVIDYTKEDFTRSTNRYDVIFGMNGFRTILEYRRSLKPKGRYIMSGGTARQMFQAILLRPWLSIFGSQKVEVVSSKPNQEDLRFLKELVESGYVKPVIDKQYCFQELPDAIHYVESGHAKGKVVIKIGF